jgi:O-antigen ligase
MLGPEHQNDKPRASTYGERSRNWTASGPPIPAIPKGATRSAGLGARAFTAAQLLIACYLLFSRLQDENAAKAAIQIGPVPIFTTDLVLVLLLGSTLMRKSTQLCLWVLSGKGAGSIGRAVWALCIAAIIYALLAVRQWKLLALRDLAIFGYSIFFPLTYFNVEHTAAVRLLRLFVYGGILTALLVLLKGAGLHVGIIGTSSRSIAGESFNTFGGGDVGGAIAFSCAGLAAYAIYRRAFRRLNSGLLALCLAALALNTTRAATVGLLLAVGLIFAVGELRHRMAMMLAALSLAAILVVGAVAPLSDFGAAAAQNYITAVAGGMNETADDDVEFRILRWRETTDHWLEHPLLGEGFGAPLVPDWLIAPTEREGLFNAGMPHNTFLMVMGRMGLLGLSLLAYCWIKGIAALVAVHANNQFADRVAAAAILLAMAGFAFFVLFLERPLNCAPFWITLALAARLSDVGPQRRRRRRDSAPATAFA